MVFPLLSVLDAGASFGGVLCGKVGSREGLEDPRINQAVNQVLMLLLL